MYVDQVDIKSVFLNGILEEDIWVWSPRGLDEFPSRLYKLRKSLYGLMQAHLAWHKKFCSDLRVLGFEELLGAACMFQPIKCPGAYFLLLYVDDLLILSSFPIERDLIVSRLKEIYDLHQSTSADWFLGVRLKWILDSLGRAREVHLSQSAYIESVLRRFGMSQSYIAHTPMTEVFWEGFSKSKGCQPTEIKLYEQVIGSLL